MASRVSCTTGHDPSPAPSVPWHGAGGRQPSGHWRAEGFIGIEAAHSAAGRLRRTTATANPTCANRGRVPTRYGPSRQSVSLFSFRTRSEPWPMRTGFILPPQRFIKAYQLVELLPFALERGARRPDQKIFASSCAGKLLFFRVNPRRWCWMHLCVHWPAASFMRVVARVFHRAEIHLAKPTRHWQLANPRPPMVSKRSEMANLVAPRATAPDCPCGRQGFDGRCAYVPLAVQYRSRYSVPAQYAGRHISLRAYPPEFWLRKRS